jgi:hypothetical protein
MRILLILAAALWTIPAGLAGAQAEPTGPRSTTERPNMSTPGLEKTLTGVLMDATCSAIADGRSDLTRTPRIVPPRNAEDSSTRSREQTAAERTQANSVPESAIPDRYRDCRLKSSSTSFALYSDNKIYMLDRISNQMMQEHMLKAKPEVPNTDGARWTMRTLVGTTTSDDVLTLRSIRK